MCARRARPILLKPTVFHSAVFVGAAGRGALVDGGGRRRSREASYRDIATSMAAKYGWGGHRSLSSRLQPEIPLVDAQLWLRSTSHSEGGARATAACSGTTCTTFKRCRESV